MRGVGLSSMEAKILAQLGPSDAKYGLQLVRESAGGIKRGTVYVLLDRLEKKGFVESTREDIPGAEGLFRIRYRITGLGSRVLAAYEGLADALVTGI